MSMVNEMDIIQEEIDRIYPGVALGEQSAMVQSDMKKWAVNEGIWAKSAYWAVLYQHAVARGWFQEGFTGLEIYGE